MTWLSFIELDKAVVHTIRLVSFLWLWFQSLCPLMPSLSIYHLTGVSLTLDVERSFLKRSLEGLMLKLKLQYFGHLMRRADSFEKTLMLGMTEGMRRWGQQRMRWLDGITVSMDMSLGNSRSWWWTGRPGVLQSMGSQRVGHDWATELNWTELKQEILLWTEFLFLLPKLFICIWLSNFKHLLFAHSSKSLASLIYQVIDFSSFAYSNRIYQILYLTPSKLEVTFAVL